MKRSSFSLRVWSGALLLVLMQACSKQKAAPPADPVVTVAPVVARDVPTVIEATGTVEPIRTAAVEAQVGGLLEKVAFHEGDAVTQGQILFQLDARPYRASEQQAEAMLVRDQAQYTSAFRDQQRFEALAAKEFVTSQQLDQARATAAGLAATVSSDSAALTQARLNLQWATIRAPINGLAGGLLVKEGNLVKANSSTPLVVINQISPILVRFAVPSTHLPEIHRHSSGGATLQVLATPVGQSAASLQTGQLTFIDNGVDSLTGTVQLKASFANRDRSLWPGGLVRVALRLDVQKGALVVPATAVVNSQQGSIVYVMGADKKVAVRKVEVGQSDDTTTVLLGGVKVGETVVTDGQLRLTDGARVALRADSTTPRVAVRKDTTAGARQ
jgi:multidrug efflux system membrane fusion protein